MEYDELSLLTDYIWEYCSEVFVKFELEVWAVNKNKSINWSRENVISRYTEDSNFFGYRSHEEIIEIVDVAFGDLQLFKETVRDRVLAEHPHVVKRCPKCDRVLRTPKAKQCRWCFHDWHNAENQQER